MGCATVKEKIESQMMLLKLERVDIMQEREDKIKELEKMTGQTVVRPPVPDYIAKDQSNFPPKEGEAEVNEEEKDEETKDEAIVPKDKKKNKKKEKKKKKKSKKKKEPEEENEDNEEEEEESEEKDEDEEEEESEDDDV